VAVGVEEVPGAAGLAGAGAGVAVTVDLGFVGGMNPIVTHQGGVEYWQEQQLHSLMVNLVTFFGEKCPCAGARTGSLS
jgi:hypothetical protein